MAAKYRLRRPWSAAEDATVSDPDMTAHEVVTRTGRSLAAVRRRKGVRSRGRNESLVHTS